MPETYRIVNILFAQGSRVGCPRTDGRYPVRIGRTCYKPEPHVGYPLLINYITNADGSDYRGYTLRTSAVVNYLDDGNKLTVETRNSIYEFEKVED